jgi:hypothetical protein
MKRRTTDEIKDEPGEPMVAKSKMGEDTVSELEVKGIEDLTRTEKKHLLLQLARDRAKDSSAGPWEITDARREEWRSAGTTLTQPMEIDIKDLGRNALFKVLLDLTQLERELEDEKIETEELKAEKREAEKREAAPKE